MIEEIEKYEPFNEEEKIDKEIMLKFISSNSDCFFRTNNIAHITSSCWILNKKHNKVLMCYHKIYNSWSWCGGHNDGDSNSLNVSLKEAREETGLKNIRPISEDIFSLEVLTVDGHYKKGKYVNSHLHLNITYLLEADEEDLLKIKEDENNGLKWMTFEEALILPSEKWMVEHIYKKLIVKTQSLNKNRV